MSEVLAAAGALFRDPSGRVLVVEPTYKDHWDIPGGVVEAGETPSEACAREVREELGLVVTPGPLLVVDWAPAGPQERVLFVFDGGVLEPSTPIVLQEAELRSCEFVPVDGLAGRLIPRLARRLAGALAALDAGGTRYLEHGVPV
ncbi:NUDIX hydrolase [Actinosynnema sp. NPDC020468]|uniref:NUDIX hydrolase n=1 Tax=Actinosynnema sp. NPDC020468 TaxID=3154488 RepID=UPI0034107AEA